MSKLLINEPPIQVLPTLATVIGLNRAIVLQQVHYWCANPKMGVARDSNRWIRNTAEDWQRDNFPFWSLSTVVEDGLWWYDDEDIDKFNKEVKTYRVGEDNER